jgi:hypothetical protein
MEGIEIVQAEATGIGTFVFVTAAIRHLVTPMVGHRQINGRQGILLIQSPKTLPDWAGDVNLTFYFKCNAL